MTISEPLQREVLKIKFWYPKDIVTAGFHMALKNTGEGEPCPRCGKDLVVIESTLVKWLNCPACKFKKLVPIKEAGTVKFAPIREV